MNHHELRSWPEHFEPLRLGFKRAEYRQDDRSPRFDRGDTLLVREWDQKGGGYTGRELVARVSWVNRGGIIPDGFAMLSVEAGALL